MTGYFTTTWRRARLVLAGLLLSGTAALAQNIGIGTDAPTQPLDVNGKLRVRGLSNPSENGRLLSVLPDGTLSVGEQLGALSGLGASSQFLPTPALSPIPLGNNNSIADMTASGGYLYLLGDNEVHVYDAATPTQLKLAGPPTALMFNRGKRLAVANGYAYVVDFDDKMDVYQLTTPTTFAYRRTVINRPPGATGVYYFDMVVSGNYLYYVGHFPGLSTSTDPAKLLTYDLTDPANPQLLNVLDVPNSRGNSRLVQLAADEQNKTIYASIGAYPLTLFQLAAPGRPTTQLAVGTTDQLKLHNTGIVGGVYYQINEDSRRIHILDIASNPSSPPMLATITAPANVYDIAFVGRYAYFSGASNSGRYIYAALVAAPSVLAFDPSGNISTQSPVMPTNADNLGNHTALQNLNLAGYQLVGNGGSRGISITSSGQVGIGTTTPTVALDVNGSIAASSLYASTVESHTVIANDALRTSVVYTPTTGSHNMLVQAYGSVGSGGNIYGSSDNYFVNHTPYTNTYRIYFSATSGLSTTNLAAAVVNLTLYGAAPGFAAYTTNTPGLIEVTTTNADGQAAERGFSFSVYLP